MDERNILVTMGWKKLGSIPGKGKIFFSSSNTPDLLKGPPNVYRG